MKYVCADNYDKVCSAYPGQPQLGRLILEEIKKDLPRLLDYYRGSLVPIDELFLLGIAWDLTAKCKAHWSQYRVNVE